MSAYCGPSRVAGLGLVLLGLAAARPPGPRSSRSSSAATDSGGDRAGRQPQPARVEHHAPGPMAIPGLTAIPRSTCIGCAWGARLGLAVADGRMPGFQDVEPRDDDPPVRRPAPPPGRPACRAREDRTVRGPGRSSEPAPDSDSALDRRRSARRPHPRRTEPRPVRPAPRRPASASGPRASSSRRVPHSAARVVSSRMTLAVELIAIVADPDLGLEPRRQLDELVGGPHVQAEAVA